ncbi:MAG: adenylate/guanylate cyclase domain-containing protein [Betaproteobacteria bacterium]
MDLRRRYRELVVLGALVWGASLAAITDGRIELVDGVLYDVALTLAPSRGAVPPRAVVVAIDERSLSSGALESVPRVFFGPRYAELLEGLVHGGATAVGFDVIFSYAASRFAAIDPTYDDALLAALARNRDRVVLARTATTPVAAPFVAALFDANRDAGREEPAAIAYSELVPSEDGVQRWIHSHYATTDGTSLPTLAARLAAIAGGPERAAPFLLAPAAPLESLPTYAFADMLRCIETDPATVRAAVAGKTVLVGSNLPEEDRKRASDRFLRWPNTPTAGTSSGACNLVAMGPSAPGSDSVPGVHIHAAAVDSLLAGTGVELTPAPARIATATVAALLCACIGLFLSPGVAVGALIAFVAALFAGSAAGVAAGHWLPIAVPAIAALAAMLGGQLARFFAEDRRRRRLETTFGCYLAPAIVSQLANADTDVALGGEEREITVMFADLSNFTGISDTMGPAELMKLTNRYFKIIVEVIDGMGGYVDKFIGDSVMAIWGAPARMPDAAAKALASALAIQAQVRAMNARRAGGEEPRFEVKIGISTGPAIVGNVGTPKRLSYTALGATVNLAARLEKVCSTFGCPIVVDAATTAALRDRYLFCELDAVSLKGKQRPVAVYEAVAPLATASAAQREYVARYETALACYRAGDPDRAATLWMEIAATSPRPGGNPAAPAIMAGRARSGERATIAPAAGA